MKQAHDILLWLSIWSVVLPAITGSLVVRRLDISSRFIWLMTVCAVVPQLTRYFTEEISVRYLVYNLCILTEFLFSVCYFWLLLADKGLRRTFLLLYSIIFLLLYTFFIQFRGIGVFFSELVCLNNLFIVSCILICFYKEVKLKGNYLISFHNPHFLYFIGWMLYAPVTLLVFALWNFLKRNPDSMLKNLWIIHDIGNVIMYLLFTIGFVLKWKLQENRTLTLQNLFNLTRRIALQKHHRLFEN